MSYHATGQIAGPNGDPIPGWPAPVSGLKGQPVRLWDVFVLGPAMIYGGWRLYQAPGRADRGIAGFLGLAGILTIALNGANFWRVEKAGTTEGVMDWSPAEGWAWRSLPPSDRIR